MSITSATIPQAARAYNFIGKRIPYVEQYAWTNFNATPAPLKAGLL